MRKGSYGVNKVDKIVQRPLRVLAPVVEPQPLIDARGVEMVPAGQPLVAVALMVLFQAHDALRVLSINIAFMERLGRQSLKRANINTAAIGHS